MSDDPETARQIAELARDTRPLLVLDVDDVVLEFVRPFMAYLQSEKHELRLESFRLSSNIWDLSTNLTVPEERGKKFLYDFFDGQDAWQTEMSGAAEAIAKIAQQAEIVMLTAMPHAYRAKRRAHLDALGFPYPLVTTEAAKGPALRALRGETDRPVAFVDDLPRNLVSAREALPDAHLFNLMSMPSLRALLPPLAADVVIVDSWADAAPMISSALGLRN